MNPDWTFDEAKAAHDKAIADGQTGPALPLFQWDALQKIAALKTAYESGDKMALFAAIRKCANHDLVMPDWVASSFIRGYDAVLFGDIGSWDQTFGRPYLKGKHLYGIRVRKKKGPAIYNRVEELRRSENAALSDI